MAGTLVVEEGRVQVGRGRPPKVREVRDYARLELGDVVQVGEDAKATVASFDSKVMVLEAKTGYRIERDGVYRGGRAGSVRVHQFAVPVGSRESARQFENLIGSVGRMRVDGEVFVRRAGRREWKQAFQDITVYYHDRIRTGDDGRGVLSIGTKATLLIAENSEAMLQDDRLLLEYGEALLQWRRRNHRYGIHTPASAIDMGVGVVRVARDRDGEERVAVLQGRSPVSPHGGRGRTLTEGTLGRVDADGALQEVARRLPAADARELARELGESLAGLPDGRLKRGDYLDGLLRKVHGVDDLLKPLRRTAIQRQKLEVGSAELGEVAPAPPPQVAVAPPKPKPRRRRPRRRSGWVRGGREPAPVVDAAPPALAPPAPTVAATTAVATAGASVADLFDAPSLDVPEFLTEGTASGARAAPPAPAPAPATTKRPRPTIPAGQGAVSQSGWVVQVQQPDSQAAPRYQVPRAEDARATPVRATPEPEAPPPTAPAPVIPARPQFSAPAERAQSSPAPRSTSSSYGSDPLGGPVRSTSDDSAALARHFQL